MPIHLRHNDDEEKEEDEPSTTPTSPSSSTLMSNSHSPLSAVASSSSTTTTTTTTSPSAPQQQLTRFQSAYNNHCYFLLPMLGWFLFSALLSSYNKHVFGAAGMGFPCPLLLTSLHFFCQWVFAESCCALWPTALGSARVSNMTWREYMDVSVPCGLVTAADIGLSNLSWVTLSLTFYTMIKSCTPIFVLMWAYLFGITRITWELVGVIALITLGEFVTVGGELASAAEDGREGGFQWTGFFMCVAATVLSGARWTLVQLKLQSLDPPLKTTIATMRLLAPSMFLSLFFVSLVIEQPWYRLQLDLPGAVELAALGLFGAVFAISMILCEFYLILKANALLLAVGGVSKEVLTIFVGVLFFGDRFTFQSFFGCCIIFAGVIWYKFTFKKEKKRGSKSKKRSKTGGGGANHHHDDNQSVMTQASTQSKEEKRGLLSSSGANNLGGHHHHHDNDEYADHRNPRHNRRSPSTTPDNDGWVLTNEPDGIEMGQQRTTRQQGQDDDDDNEVAFPQLKIV
eukprot:CAMPEP_0168798770 /NCGR_PEP_ID=MMETSP0725-20121227/18071_1 /TAXON_ID=265536 /ORGANISM="Amphiprora sp., Strain CCMP467" /LENGTH=512 /DNA_ID=CAMNT_0008850185 /DNA_START=1621 /DNA_END=3159 /DNA_ORIENTATION=+